MGLFGGGKSAGTVVVDVEGDLSKFTDDVKGAAGIAEREIGGAFGRATKVAGTAMLGAAGAAIGTGLSQFTDFERGMNEVFTLLPDISGEAMGTMTGQVKDFASEFGVLPSEVVPALYEALGAGVPQDNVFAFLESANKLAKGGATDLATAVDGLSSVTNAYGSDVIDAQRASDIMFKTVGLGKGTVDEVAGSLFQVTPIAAAMGVSFEDVGAALAALTAQGTPVSVAATQIRGVIGELGKSGTKASKVFEEATGKTFPEFIAEGGNLSNALHIMDDAAFENEQSLIDMFGSIEAGQAALGLMKGGGEQFFEFGNQMRDSAGSTQAAFERMDQGLGPTLDKIKARLSVAFINLGATLAPQVGQIGEAVAQFVDIMSKLPGPVLAGIVGAVAGIGALLVLAGPILKAVQVVKMFSSGLSLLAANPWAIVIIAAIAAVILIIKYWDEITAALAASWAWVQAEASRIWNAIKEFFVQWWPLILGIMTGGVGLVVALVIQNWDAIRNKTTEIWNGIMGFLGGVLGAIGGFFQTYVIGPVEWIIGLFESLPGRAKAAWDGVVSTISSAVATLRGLLSEVAELADRALGPLDEIGGAVGKLGGGLLGKVPGFDTGGVVPGPRGAPRLILAHAGETVLPTHKSADVGFGGGMVIQGPLIGHAQIANDLDIEQVARELDRRLLREKRAQGRAK